MVNTPISHDGWRFAPLVLPALLALCDGPPAAAQGRAVTDPAEIDRAVEAFTGAAIGTPGGARTAADPRLQLAACQGPLAVNWHGPARAAVQVECPGPTSWRTFLAVASGPGATTAPAAKSAPAVKRGDAITVMVRGRGFSVQQTGEAMEAGAIGEWIFVRTSRKAEALRARIERPGLAIVPVG
jgi:flagella basal body P-ring formation protein FlgA